MSLFKKASLSSVLAAQCLFAGLAVTTQAQAAQIPDYFFKGWTVAKNCTEQHAGLAARAEAGLKFLITPDTSRRVVMSSRPWTTASPSGPPTGMA